MALETQAIYQRTELEKGVIDFSQHASVSNAVVPGILIRVHTANRQVRVTDIIVYNAHAGAAVITFYDEDSNIYLVVSAGNGETIALTLKASIVWGYHDIYARTDQVTNAEVTVAGREFP